MALTMADLEDVQMEVREQYRQFQQEADAAWFKPLRETLIGSMWHSLPGPVRQQYHLNSPQAAQVMDKRYRGGTNGRSI
jgi:hypothetical protein